MLYLKEAVVKEIIESKNDIDTVKVIINDEERIAINYKDITGNINISDKVIINVIAQKLGLGSGGKDFIYYNRSNALSKTTSGGHIIKERYTPWQFPVLSVEEQNSKYHSLFKERLRLDGLPVAVGTLHSQIPAFSLTLKHIKPDAKVVYIMTDGAALPIKLSNVVKSLVDMKVIEKTITFGQAFGGDLEAINIFSALITAKHVCKADVVLVTMGPGITGTGTELGFTGIEQGQILNAVSSLGGKPIALSRISFADKRERHLGLSHHSITSLDVGCQVKADVPLPKLSNEQNIRVEKQIKNNQLSKKHNISFQDSEITIKLLKKYMPALTTMGRGIDKEKEFFASAGAAAIKAAGYL